MKTSQHTVLITGGTSGIGLALAKQFLANDNRVIITGRDSDKLARVQKQFPDIETWIADMTKQEDLKRLVRQYPDVNVLVNNAGVQFDYDFSDPTVPPDRIDVEVATNFTGVLHLIQLYLPQLIQHDTAAIVNVTSGLGILPKTNTPVYCGTKAGLHVFTQALRWQFASTSVRVFEIIPSQVDTPMTQDRGKRKMSPDEVATAFWKAFAQDHYEIRLGIFRYLIPLHRLFPNAVEKLVRANA